jgi:hypothetical protein
MPWKRRLILRRCRRPRVKPSCSSGTTGSCDQAPAITEDTMPGELPNIVSGRVANVLNLRGPNFITDAACAVSFAAINAAFEMLTEHHVDAVIAGGVDRNMGAPSFVKFCKIGALSATGSRPFGDGADGFVMGEGSGVVPAQAPLRRRTRWRQNLRRHSRRGRLQRRQGQGHHRPQPRRPDSGGAAGLGKRRSRPGHGHTGRGARHQHPRRRCRRGGKPGRSLRRRAAPQHRPGLGQEQHRPPEGGRRRGRSAQGDDGLHHKVLPPTLNSERPNPNIDFANSPFYPDPRSRRLGRSPAGTPRRAGVSAYGFGGTNFHLVLEEHVPGMLREEPKSVCRAAATVKGGDGQPQSITQPGQPISQPMLKITTARHLCHGRQHAPNELKNKLDEAFRQVEGGWTPRLSCPIRPTSRPKSAS